MKLLPPELALREDTRRSFRTSRVATGVMLVIYAGFSAVAVRLLVAAAPHVPTVAWFIVVPVLVIAALLGMLILGTLWGALVASFRLSNWVMQVTRDEVLLNLRSYLNAHFENAEPTVLCLTFAEIKSAGRVRERRVRPSEDDRSVEIRSWLELTLAGVDTSALDAAVRAERAKQAPTRVFLGVRSRSKTHDVPVFVSAPGVVRVAWKRGMLEALADSVAIAPARDVDLDASLSDRSVDERCLARLERGDRMDAIETARVELGIGLTEAVRRVDELQRRSA